MYAILDSDQLLEAKRPLKDGAQSLICLLFLIVSSTDISHTTSPLPPLSPLPQF